MKEITFSKDYTPINTDISLVYIPKFISSKTAEKFCNIFERSIIWNTESYKMFGKVINAPRLIALYGDNGISYKYSGVNHVALLWTKELIDIKRLIESEINYKFNSVLLNFYRSGCDSMGWHSDNEKVLGSNPKIASLSLGSERKILFRNIYTKKTVFITLQSGSLLFMKGNTQSCWKHSIPKTRVDKGKRINLTFRYIQ